MTLAKRVQQLPPYLFVGISRIIAAKRAQGIDVVDFGIGDPDIPTPEPVLDALKSASDTPANHRYPESEGLPEFRQAVADWYERRFGIGLDPATEAINLIGAKEGIGHAALCFIDPGDVALVPDPAYPVYSIGTMFAGGESHYVPLLEKNDWLVDFADITSDAAKKAKVIWLNYPNNPTGAVAPLEFYREAVEFARQFDLYLLHGGHLRRLRCAEHPPGRWGPRVEHGVPLAVQDGEHDRLAGWDGRWQLGYGQRTDAGQVEHRLRTFPGHTRNGYRRAGTIRGVGRRQ